MIKNGDAILVIRNDRLGDTILAFPVAKVLKENFPQSSLTFCCHPQLSSLIENVDGIDYVISAGDSDYRALISALHEHHHDVAFCLRSTPQNAYALWRSCIPVRVGSGRRLYSFFYTHKENTSRRRNNLHEADLNLKLVRCFGIDGSDGFPIVSVPPEATEFIEKRLTAVTESQSGRLIIIHPGSGGSARDWPLRHFKRLADDLMSEADATIVVTGSQGENEKCAFVAGESHLDLCGETNLLQLAALILKADLLISNSTGPLHLAVALDRRVLGLYPPVKNCTPDRWGPYQHPEWTITPQLPICKKCRRGEYSSCHCMETMSPATVLARSLQILNE